MFDYIQYTKYYANIIIYITKKTKCNFCVLVHKLSLSSSSSSARCHVTVMSSFFPLDLFAAIMYLALIIRVLYVILTWFHNSY